MPRARLTAASPRVSPPRAPGEVVSKTHHEGKQGRGKSGPRRSPAGKGYGKTGVFRQLPHQPHQSLTIYLTILILMISMRYMELVRLVKCFRAYMEKIMCSRKSKNNETGLTSLTNFTRKG